MQYSLHWEIQTKFNNICEDVKSPNVIPVQRAFTCSKLIIETLGQGVKYVQS